MSRAQASHRDAATGRVRRNRSISVTTTVRRGGVVCTMQSGFPRRPPRLDQLFSVPVYFVTFCTYRRRLILANRAVHIAFEDFAASASADHHIAVGRYVIMPDHLHLLVCGGYDFRLGEWLKLL